MSAHSLRGRGCLPRNGARAKKASRRLLWDELLTPMVPRALRELGLRASYVGHQTDGSPRRGSTDEAIIEYAKRTNQVIVTSNHDMMLLCSEEGQRFVWLDPRGKQMGGIEQTLIIFEQIEDWESILDSNPDVCVRSMRTKCLPITSTEAVRLAKQRMKAITRRARKKTPKALGPFVER